MSKLKAAIEKKDWLTAKRLILDNPKYLEENVDLVLGMIERLMPINDMIGSVDDFTWQCENFTNAPEGHPLKWNHDPLKLFKKADLDYLKDKFPPPKFEQQYMGSWEKHPEETVDERKDRLKKAIFGCDIIADNTIPTDSLHIIGEKNAVEITNIGFDQQTKQFYGIDPASPDGDFGCELGGHKDKEGKLIVTHVALTNDVSNGYIIKDESEEKPLPKFKITNPWEDSEKSDILVGIDPGSPKRDKSSSVLMKDGKAACDVNIDLTNFNTDIDKDD